MPGSCTLEQIQCGVISLSAVPAEVGCVSWNLPLNGHECPGGAERGQACGHPLTHGGTTLRSGSLQQLCNFQLQVDVGSPLHCPPEGLALSVWCYHLCLSLGC